MLSRWMVSRITAHELAALLRPAAAAASSSSADAPTPSPSTSLPSPSVLVVDVRDDDFSGGHITGALNIPSTTLYRQMDRIQQLSADKDLVVFHCPPITTPTTPALLNAPLSLPLSHHLSLLSLLPSAVRCPVCVGMLSQKRGPAAAEEFARHLRQSADREGGGKKVPRVAVLDKGFQGWVSHVHSRHREGEEVSGLLHRYEADVWGYDFSAKKDSQAQPPP